MATVDEIKEAAETGLIGGLKHESVQENDRVLRFPDPSAILDIGGKLNREEAAAGRKYGGPRRLRADFSESDR